MPKISEDQRQARRGQILTASWRCFTRRGIQSTCMEEIFHEANISAGAVYLYYKSKDELIFAAISTSTREMRALLVPPSRERETLPPTVFVRELIEGIATFTRRDEHDAKVVALMVWCEAQSNAKVKTLIARVQRSYLDALTSLVREWQRRGDFSAVGKPAIIAKIMLSFFLGFIVRAALLGGLDTDTAAMGIDGLIGRSSGNRAGSRLGLTGALAPLGTGERLPATTSRN